MASHVRTDGTSSLCDATAECARDCLLLSSHPAIRRLSCEYVHGVLLLHGRLSSYYLKQLAQEAVRGLEGVAQVVNQIEVHQQR